ncbi:MAG TPA: hypothetical protein DD643_01820 [Synechococcus sp. UBA8638]|nr:hypothetical protein [Synechococcus sp. UBA8638]
MLNPPNGPRPVSVTLPLAVVFCLALVLGSACSGRDPRPSSGPQQSAGAPLQEPVASGNGDGDMVSPLPVDTGSSLDARQDNPASRDNAPVVDVDAYVVHSDLYNAVANGHTEVVDTLIAEIRAGIRNEWDRDRVVLAVVEDAKANTLLHVAAANGHGAVAKLLLQAGASVTAQNNDNKTPADLARQHGHENLAQRLERVPQLLAAAADGDVAQVETLLAAGVYVNARRLRGRGLGPMPLHDAAEKGYAHVARLLVEAGANVNARVPQDFYNTPLHLAAHAGHTAVVKLLIDVGASLDERALGGSTPLLLATGNERGDPEPAKLLIQAGADPNIPNRYGRTPLFWVVMNGQAELVRLLLQAGADANAADRYGATPLRFAAESGSVDIAEALLSAGADVNPDPSSLPTFHDGNTPLLAAVGGRNPTAMVALLIRHGVDVNAKDEHGNAPLHLVIHEGNGALAKLLIEGGADVLATNNAGNSPVQVAAFAGLPEVITLLVEAGAPINVQDQVGDTPLHDAALQGRVEAARVLLDAGADVNIKNNEGKTPLNLARQHGHENVADLLIDAGAGLNAAA